MCKFFSLISDGNGKAYYFDWEQRKKILKKEDGFNYESADSHTSIADFYRKSSKLDYIKVNESKERIDDRVNKYEFNPLTKEFTIDQINVKDDSSNIKEFCLNLDFKKIVKPLNIKRIFHPLKDIKAGKVTKQDIKNIKIWASVRDSIWASVGASVGDSVGDSVRASVGDSVRASVRDSVGDSVWVYVWDSVWDFVGDSVWVSVWASVWDSVGDSVGASIRASVGASVTLYVNIDKYKYIDHKKGVNPFQSCLDLWNKGLVPSFDGTTWRLHACENAKVVFSITKEELEKVK